MFLSYIWALRAIFLLYLLGTFTGYVRMVLG